MPQPADGPARRRDDDAHGARPAAMDRAASDAGQAHNLDPTHPAHPRHALYQGCAAGVDALDRQLGRAPDERSACMKASLAELAVRNRSEEHTSELQSLMRISYAVFCLKKNKHK